MNDSIYSGSFFDICLEDNFFPKKDVGFPGLEVAPLFNNAVWEARKNVQAPFELVAMTALSAMSLAAQRGTDLRTPFGGVIPLSLWILGIAESGERKDGLRNYFFKGINECDSADFAAKQDEMISWKAEDTLWKRRLKMLEREADKLLKNGGEVEGVMREIERLHQERKRPPVYTPSIIEDITSPALAKHLIESNGIAGIVSSEGGAFLQSAVVRDIPLLNSAWSGSEINISRKGDGAMSVRDPRVSLMMLIQPGALESYLVKKGVLTRDMGFWARFLVAKPSSTQGQRIVYDGCQSYVAREKFAMRCKEIINSEQPGRGVIELSNEASETWRRISNDIEVSLRDGLHFDRARDHASKLSENILRVAGVLHVFEGRSGQVNRDLLLLAVKICAYCSSMFMSIFDKREQASIHADVLGAWLSGYVKNGARYMPLQFLYHRAPSPMRSKKNLLPALEVLVGRGCIGWTSYGRMAFIDMLPNLPGDGYKMAFDSECFVKGVR